MMGTDGRSEADGSDFIRIKIWGLALLAVAYFALSIGVWQLADPAYVGAPWWPAAGLTLGLMAVSQMRDWPAIALTIFVADIAADLVQDAPIGTSIAWGFANSIEPLLGAAALRYAFNGCRPDFDSPANVGRFFVVVALAGAPLASAIGSAASAITYDLEWLTTWRDWYTGDVLGILVLAPTVIFAGQIKRAFGLKLAATFAAVAIVSGIVFWSTASTDLLRPYLLTPLLVLAALYFGAAGAAGSGLIMATLANLGSALGYGPFAQTETANDPLIKLQLFTAIQLLTAYLLVGVRAQLISMSSRVEELGEEALRDPLTGVGNRDQLERAFANGMQPDSADVAASCAVLVVDLDDFKPINDVFGRDIGDEVLKLTAQRIASAVRSIDSVARLGGDVFAVVCPGISQADANRLAIRLERDLAEPMTFDHRRLEVGVSVGTSWVPEPLEDFSQLLRVAGKRMIASKTLHKQRFAPT